jgi:delta1-piperideine-2-carboxylate reductase
MTSLSLSAIKSLCLDALCSPRVALNQPSAEAITSVILAAERDGCKSHGVFRLPGYCAGILHKKVDPLSEPIITSVSPGVVLCDAQHGYAPLAFERALPELAKKAKLNGIASLSIRNSFHFAALWYEAEKLAADHSLASLVFVNSKSYVAQPGGTGRRLFGTNPMSFGFPRNGQSPLIIDQASSVMSRGEIMLHKGCLPEGVGLDADGKPSRDAQAVLEGAQLPFGGIKGANIALMVELLASGMTDSPFSFEAHEEDPNWFGPTRHGEFIIAMDPCNMGADAAHAEMLFQRLSEDGGRLPGSRRHQTRDQNRAEEGGGGEDSVHVIDESLLNEIHGIIEGRDNITQGYLYR